MKSIYIYKKSEFKKIRFKSKKSDLNQKNRFFLIFIKKNHDFYQPC